MDDGITGLLLAEENDLRFPRFTSEDAYTLGQHIRKRFKGSQRCSKGKGIAIAVKSVAGHILYACTVGECGDVNLEYWTSIEGMIATVIKTGHSTYYVERNLTLHGRSPDQYGLVYPEYRLNGGAFPIWLTNSTVAPIAVVSAYAESSQEDHQLVVKSIRDYLLKVHEEAMADQVGSPGLSHRRAGSVASLQ
ncbi:hypothetical protein FRC20_010011 [Serendipita sp. 405]|nr:hypothetical protein FRC20_010011 [Serendipita sp. 405]